MAMTPPTGCQNTQVTFTLTISVTGLFSSAQPSAKWGAPVVEAMHKLFQQQLGYGTWSTYFYYLPRDLDQAHRRSGSIVWISFAEAYALRGEDIPTALP